MSSKYKRACVTGGAGFIGSKLVRALLARGLSVVVLDNLSVGKAENVPDEAELIVGDILDQEKALQAVRGCDVVFHMAARVAIRSSYEFAVEDTITNVGGTASIVRAGQRAETVRRLIFASSMAIYADADAPTLIDENHPAIPISPYGISKLAGERLVQTMCANTGIQNAVLRLFNTYGPGQVFSPYVGVVTIFTNKLLKREQPQIYGDGRQCRDFVHVDDVVAGFVAAMDSDVTGEIFNIGTGTATTVNQVYDYIRKNLQNTVAAAHVPAVDGELRYSIADISRARQMIGYTPRHRFEQSIAEVVAEIADA